jgi:ABC-type Na+ efflux pump permease subunit
MNKTWAVFRYEFLKTVTRRSFILTLILIPLIPTLLLGALKIIGGPQKMSIQQVRMP